MVRAFFRKFVAVLTTYDMGKMTEEDRLMRRINQRFMKGVMNYINALVPGVILGIAIPFLINLSLRKAFPVLYHIPWAALFGGIFVLIGIVFFITRTEIHKLRDKSIIDEIRMDIV